MDVRPYERAVYYYETDQMGIVHHSNYIRWLEEARIDLMDQLNIGYKALEDMGIMIPVLSVSCNYKSMVRFGDTVLISMKFTSYNGIKMAISYEVTDKASGELRCTGTSSHCFLRKKDNSFVSLKRGCPEYHRVFMDYYERELTVK